MQRYIALQHFVVLCSAMQHYVMLHSATQRYIALLFLEKIGSATQCYAVLVTLHSATSATQHYVALPVFSRNQRQQRYVALCSAMQRALCSTAQHCIVLCSATQHCIALCVTTQRYIMFSSTATGFCIIVKSDRQQVHVGQIALPQHYGVICSTMVVLHSATQRHF